MNRALAVALLGSLLLHVLLLAGHGWFSTPSPALATELSVQLGPHDSPATPSPKPSLVQPKPLAPTPQQPLHLQREPQRPLPAAKNVEPSPSLPGAVAISSPAQNVATGAIASEAGPEKSSAQGGAAPASQKSGGRSLVSPPTCLRLTEPSLPETSRQLGETGSVRLRLRISAAGEVEHVEILASSGYARLDKAAQALVRNWRCQAAHQGDTRVSSELEETILYQLH